MRTRPSAGMAAHSGATFRALETASATSAGDDADTFPISRPVRGLNEVRASGADLAFRADDFRGRAPVLVAVRFAEAPVFALDAGFLASAMAPPS
jgi:hypothetical protein